MKLLAAFILGLLAVFCALAGSIMPSQLSSQAADNRIYYQQFQKAARFIDAHGKLPDTNTLSALAEQSKSKSIWHSITDEPSDCDPDFVKAPSDRFVLSFWRGESSECYAHPSGKTTMPMSESGYLWSGLGVELAIFWMIAIASAWAAWRLIRSWLSTRKQ